MDTGHPVVRMEHQVVGDLGHPLPRQGSVVPGERLQLEVYRIPQ